MRTFSELIDIAVNTTGLAAKLEYAIVSANGVVRDLITNHDSDFMLAEHRIIAERGSFVRTWRVPADYKEVRAVKYNCEKSGFVPLKKPGRVQTDYNRYWYQSGRDLHFTGNPHTVDIAYYKIHTTMLYRPQDKRLFRSHSEDTYQVRNTVDTPWIPYNPDDTAHVKLYDQNTNWILEQYYDAVLEGLLSRMRNEAGDVQRGGRHHQQYRTSKSVISRSTDSHLVGEM